MHGLAGEDGGDSPILPASLPPLVRPACAGARGVLRAPPEVPAAPGPPDHHQPPAPGAPRRVVLRDAVEKSLLGARGAKVPTGQLFFRRDRRRRRLLRLSRLRRRRRWLRRRHRGQLRPLRRRGVHGQAAGKHHRRRPLCRRRLWRRRGCARRTRPSGGSSPAGPGCRSCGTSSSNLCGGCSLRRGLGPRGGRRPPGGLGRHLSAEVPDLPASPCPQLLFRPRKFFFFSCIFLGADDDARRLGHGRHHVAD